MAATTETLLAFSGLHKAFAGLHLLGGASAQVRAGEVVLLEGGNGAGKTTLLNILGGAVAPDAGEIIFGSGSGNTRFRYPEAAWRQVLAWPVLRPETVARHGIGRVWQDVRLFESLNLRDNLSVADPWQPGETLLANLWRPTAVRRHEDALQQRMGEVLTALGLGGRADTLARHISFGQAKRVAMARALAARGRLLLLDEPLAGLDDEGRARLVADLRQHVRDRALALVIVEHASNRAPLLPLVTTQWRLEQGHLHVSNTTAAAQSTHASDPFNDLLDRLNAGYPPRYRREILLPGGATLQVFGYREAAGSPSLAVRGLRIRRGEQQMVAGGEQGAALDFALYNGETAVLRAPNGWGKTSLLEALAGVIAPACGEMRLDTAQTSPGADISRLPAFLRARAGLAFLQSRDQGFPGLSVRETLSLSGIEHIPELLQPLAARQVADLSGGERQLLALLCVMLRPGARVRLLDEPFTGLDATTHAEILRTQWRTDGVNLVALPGNR